VTVLVTGADGFVGRWLVRALVAAGHKVIAAAGPGPGAPADLAATPVRWTSLDLRDTGSVDRFAAEPADAVVHLAGLASGAQSLADPGLAWEVNAVGTARLLAALGTRCARGEADPRVLVVSTAEVYGAALQPLRETDPVRPRSPYAASKAAAELAAFETAERTGLRVVVARAFPHTGPGQDARFVAPALAQRLLAARRSGARAVRVGNLDAVRDFSDVRDVVAAYITLLAVGRAGESYNVASGSGLRVRDLFDRLAAIVGVEAVPEPDAALMRPSDLPVLVGDATKLRATGWAPVYALETTLRDLVHAEAH
jgi:GDP-4-dehydro-6-deoxy-D-mannose reductase